MAPHWPTWAPKVLKLEAEEGTGTTSAGDLLVESSSFAASVASELEGPAFTGLPPNGCMGSFRAFLGLGSGE